MNHHLNSKKASPQSAIYTI